MFCRISAGGGIAIFAVWTRLRTLRDDTISLFWSPKLEEHDSRTTGNTMKDILEHFLAASLLGCGAIYPTSMLCLRRKLGDSCGVRIR